MTPSIPVLLMTLAISTNWASSKSGAIFKTSLGFRAVNSDGGISSRAAVTPINSCSSNSRFCRPLVKNYIRLVVNTQKKNYTHRKPGVFGLDTLTTNTSEYGPKVRTPKTKSSIDSGVEVLFFPRLTARSAPCRSDEVEKSSAEKNDGIRARNRERTDAWP